ncbi:ABC transporter permease [Rhodobacter sp. SGA-6-6]|uniref:ABC transporter permease n=1 Tax=Rhodobacter sp. SGA-6-6 TaxID=2710882 RepID=UPI0013EC8097|nr:ABC transporter permease [Rhodobacter sp. SGA-6-6]NGM46044.1 ABC transporter permease [Rhodobacter sp. SGA-6-6]
MSRAIFWVSTVLALLFLVVPLALVMPLAFNGSSFLTYPMEGFSLKWFEEVFTEGNWVRAFGNSLKVALGTTAVALVIGGLAATGLMLTGRWLQIVLTGLFVSPMIVPSIVIGVAFAYSFGRMGLSGSYAGLVLSHSILAAPLVFLSILTSLRGLDPDLDLAAASLGASRGQRFRHVTLPLAAPGFAAGALFAFTTSFDEVVVALFVASPDSLTLPVALFAGLRDRLQPTLVVVALLLSLISFAFLWLMARLQRLNAPQKP